MKRLTLFRLPESQIIYLDLVNQDDITLFLSVINGEAKTNVIDRKQEMTIALKNRLSLFDIIGEKAYQLKDYFGGIPVGQFFLIIPGHIEDELAFHRFLTQLAKINGIFTETPVMDRIYNHLQPHYEIRTFNGTEHRKIGVYDKTKRVCRFCGRSQPETSFKKKAHAISESLGNKNLICLEECDECNSRFSKTIEQDIAHIFSLNLTLHGVFGKKGIPTIKGDGFSMKIDTSTRKTLGRTTVVFTFRDMPNSRDPQTVAKSISKKYPLYSEYIPQNVYKCLCKYVLSLVDSSELQYFKETIAWINEPIKKLKLPPIWHYSVPNAVEAWDQSTSMIIMRRKHSKKDLPYCWAIIIIAGNPYLFIVPFCSQDKYRFVGKGRQELFISGIKEIMPNVVFHPINLNGTKQVRPILRSSFEIPPECKEGSDYYFLDKTTD